MKVFEYIAAVARGVAGWFTSRSKRRAEQPPLPSRSAKPQRRPGRNAPCPCGKTKERQGDPVFAQDSLGNMLLVPGPLYVVPVKFKHCHGAPERMTLSKLRDLAFGAFPNHFGNYLGKREPRPIGSPLTPAERFYRLAGEYLCRARDYRFKRPAPTA
jgi:hypothetical protein